MSTARSASNNNKQSKVINLNRREKLRNLLLSKFVKKYKLNPSDKQVLAEIDSFLHRKNLTEKDLICLDGRINSIVNSRSEHENLARNLSNDPAVRDRPEQMKLPEIKGQTDAVSVRSNNSRLSGASKFSKFSAKKLTYNGISRDEIPDDLSDLDARDPIKRVELPEGVNEWKAINEFNQKLYEQDKINEKVKDKEVKRRCREDLDNQVRQKLERLNNDHLMAREYDTILLKHLEYLESVEKAKQEAMRQKILKEKENRDRQMKDEQRRKRTEKKEERTYDRGLSVYLTSKELKGGHGD